MIFLKGFPLKKSQAACGKDFFDKLRGSALRGRAVIFCRRWRDNHRRMSKYTRSTAKKSLQVGVFLL